MFSNLTTSDTLSNISTGLAATGVAAGIIISVVRKSGFWGAFGWSVGLGLAGGAIGLAIESIGATTTA